mmetsp:Transcript_11439/g.36124  ORF Transcript_11439/g.36124 Transcript_11439/m.36124 type:complete len:260 (+) Transcript_11439:676-1455(+)
MLAMSPEKQQMLLKYPWAVLKAASTETQLDALMDLSSEVSKVRGGLRAVDLSIIAHTFKRMIPESAVGFMGFSAALMVAMSVVSSLVCGASVLGAGLLVMLTGVTVAITVAVGTSFFFAAWIAAGVAFFAMAAYTSIMGTKVAVKGSYHACAVGSALVEYLYAATSGSLQPAVEAVAKYHTPAPAPVKPQAPAADTPDPPVAAPEPGVEVAPAPVAAPTPSPAPERPSKKKAKTASRAAAHDAAAAVLRSYNGVLPKEE